MSKTIGCILMVLLFAAGACKKTASPPLRFFEVGLDNNSADWRDTSFIVATADTQLLTQIEAQLNLPVEQRKKIVLGKLVKGSGGYNKNATHTFKWHFKEDDWGLADFSIEIYDGRPYNDVDLSLTYWLETVERFSPWSSYIKKEIIP